jgi:Carboxypeptidase regulatory-like domain
LSVAAKIRCAGARIDRERGHLERCFGCFLLLIASTSAAPLWSQNPDNPRPSFSAESSSMQSSEITKVPLPDTPSVSKEGSASVSGSILDPDGAAVSGAKVTLAEVGKTEGRLCVTGIDGRFTFTNILSGSYLIRVEAKGFQATPSATFSIAATQDYEVPSVKLSVAPANTEIVVQPTEVIAAQQMAAEEKQRVRGIIPDFYVSYIWNATPLDARQKFSLAARITFDPVVFIGVSLGAGIEQATDAFPGYGQGAEGYAKRWGALFVNGRTSDFLRRAVFPSLFHQDPRYFYQGSGTKWSRTKHAISYAFVARSDSGHLMPNYSYFLGDVCSGALSNLYYPSSSRGASLVFTNAAIGLAGRAGLNLAREFLLKRITTNVPGNGKPALGNGSP